MVIHEATRRGAKSFLFVFLRVFLSGRLFEGEKENDRICASIINNHAAAGRRVGLGRRRQSPRRRGRIQPYVVEYYYKAKWGFADEFIQLFKKNHLPVLKKQVESGRI